MSSSDELDEIQLAQLAFERSPFGELPIDEAWDLQISQPEWMLDKLIPAKSVGMIYGPSNSGKSHLLCDIIAAQVMGKTEWQGIPIQPGAVVLFTESIGHIKARLRAYIDQHGGEPVYPLWVLPSMSIETRDIRFLIMWLDMLPQKVVHLAFDTVATSFSFEENDNREASSLIRRLEDVLSAMHEQSCITLVHHTSKASEGHSARGASALIGNIDFSWHVQYDKKAGLTIANWEKDRWRLFSGVSRWSGTMHRVPVQFTNASAEMAILEWAEYSEEAQELTQQLQAEGRLIAMKRELDDAIDATREPFILTARGARVPNGLNKFVWPESMRRPADTKMLREYLIDTRETEPVYNRSGNEIGVIIGVKKVYK